MKTLLAVTTYNQLEYTKIFYDYFSKLNLPDIDLIIFDDKSTDSTVDWCKQNNIKVIENERPSGLTYSWNNAYKYFKNHLEYNILIIANNDIIIPKGAIEELLLCHKKWPSICIVPITTATGCGHNGQQSILNYYDNIVQEPEYTQDIQDAIIHYKRLPELKNHQMMFDPFRMRYFNGFFFSLKRKIIEYEMEDGNMFDPKLLNFKNEDDLNWRVLLPNDEYPMLCKTCYIYHYKGKSFAHVKNSHANDLETFVKSR